MQQLVVVQVACELPWLLQREEVVCCWMGNLFLFLLCPLNPGAVETFSVVFESIFSSCLPAEAGMGKVKHLRRGLCYCTASTENNPCLARHVPCWDFCFPLVGLSENCWLRVVSRMLWSSPACHCHNIDEFS